MRKKSPSSTTTTNLINSYSNIRALRQLMQLLCCRFSTQISLKAKGTQNIAPLPRTPTHIKDKGWRHESLKPLAKQPPEEEKVAILSGQMEILSKAPFLGWAAILPSMSTTKIICNEVSKLIL